MGFWTAHYKVYNLEKHLKFRNVVFRHKLKEVTEKKLLNHTLYLMRYGAIWHEMFCLQCSRYVERAKLKWLFVWLSVFTGTIKNVSLLFYISGEHHVAAFPEHVMLQITASNKLFLKIFIRQPKTVQVQVRQREGGSDIYMVCTQKYVQSFGEELNSRPVKKHPQNTCYLL